MKKNNRYNALNKEGKKANLTFGMIRLLVICLVVPFGALSVVLFFSSASKTSNQVRNTVVTSIVKREDTQIYESHEVVEKSFGGSLPKFLTAFFGNKKISNDEAEELKNLIDSYKED